ncbi:MAG TPA: hypothetical protein PLO51_03050, partial [Candidatus Micrarchaeota archaeon]|nr:hypothetical protein [Candidatus Micrarchaeota archaeon]
GSSAYATNTSSFEVGAATQKWEKNTTGGTPFEVSSSKQKYTAGETAIIYANITGMGETPDTVTAEVDKGYRFGVDLPFTIPILNLERLADITGWMVFCSFFVSLALNPIMPRLIPSLG